LHNELDFKKWLKYKRGLTESSIKKYTLSLLQISSFLSEKELIQLNLYEVDNFSYLKKVIKIYFDDRKNKERDKRGHNQWSAAANNLIKYFESDMSSETMEKSFPSTFDDNELNSSVEKLLKKPLSGKPKGNKKPESKSQKTKVIKRDPLVIAWILQNAKGKCEGCSKKAPFIRAKDNSPYLEVHHVKQLKDGGPDTVGNAVALCPNCHRKAHYSNEKKDFIKILKSNGLMHETM